jgi:hypothetical protein
MDGHKLDAPNNDELKSIDQIGDHSSASTVYRKANDQFEGEILSAKAREKAKAEELEAITSGLGRNALRIGLLVPYPFISGLLLTVGVYTTVTLANASIFFGIVIIAAGLWLISSYYAYSAIYKIFYKHALRAGPFLAVMLINILIVSQAIYGLVVQDFAVDNLVYNAGLISLLLLLYSFIVSYILVGIWGNSRLKSSIKALVSALSIAVSAFLVGAVYLF